MNIKTPLPLTMETLKDVITATETVSVEIDYANSKLRGRAALIYLTNANIPNPFFNVKNVDKEQVYELVDAYITQKSTLNVVGLVAAALQLMFHVKGITSLSLLDNNYFIDFSPLSTEDMDKYLANDTRRENVLRLIHVLDNIPLFVFSCNTSFKSTFGEPKDAFPTIDNIDYTGFTFINMINHPVFQYNYYTVPSSDSMCYFIQQYEQPLFGGRTLFGLLSQDQSPILSIFDAIMAGDITTDRLDSVNKDIAAISSM